MYYWIFQNNIVGTSDRWIEDSNRPNGYDLLEGPAASFCKVYFDAAEQEIKFRPLQPNPYAYWDFVDHKWVDA